MSKLTGLQSIVRKNSIYGANNGFHTITFARSLGRWRCFKPRAADQLVKECHLISQVYMDEVLRSVVLPFCAKTSDSTRPRMAIPERTSLEPAKTMLCALTGQFAHQHVYNFNMSMTYWTEGITHNNAPRNHQPLDAVMQEILMLIPSAPNHQ